jgi:midasin
MTTMDHSRLEILMVIGQSIGACEPDATDRLEQLIKTWHNMLGRIRTTSQMKTGMSMERMWAFLKPRVASTFESLQQLLKLEELTERFDSLTFRNSMPLRQLVDIRMSFSTALKTFNDHKAPVADLIPSLQQSLQSLESLSNQQMHAVLPHFGSVFELITQSLIIDDSPKDLSILSFLELLASRPTVAASATELSGFRQNDFQCIPVPMHRDDVCLANDDLHARLLLNM